MQHINHIFFDLDHTIWDFDRNAQETLTELYHKYQLDKIGLPSAAAFIETYTENNHELWRKYHLGEITKSHLREERFRKTFLDLGVEPALVPHQFEDDYVKISPTKTNLFERATEVLTYLSSKYSLHIISNGFKETQAIKMDKCDLNCYFTHIIISEDAGANKPEKAIFEYALRKAGAIKPESIMIGDSLEADVYGALGFGIDAIFFNPLKVEKPADIKRQIHHLEELLEIF